MIATVDKLPTDSPVERNRVLVLAWPHDASRSPSGLASDFSNPPGRLWGRPSHRQASAHQSARLAVLCKEEDPVQHCPVSRLTLPPGAFSMIIASVEGCCQTSTCTW